MTNEERLKEMRTEEIAEFICNMIDLCERCKGSEFCKSGHKGLIDWLKMEEEESAT